MTTTAADPLITRALELVGEAERELTVQHGALENILAGPMPPTRDVIGRALANLAEAAAALKQLTQAQAAAGAGATKR